MIESSRTYLAKDCKTGDISLPRGGNESYFHSKNTLFSIRQLLTADFERVSTVCALLARLTKNTNRLVSPIHRVYL